MELWDAKRRKPRKLFNLKCSSCGAAVQKERDLKQVRCFDCRVKNLRRYAQKAIEKNKREQNEKKN